MLEIVNGTDFLRAVKDVQRTLERAKKNGFYRVNAATRHTAFQMRDDLKKGIVSAYDRPTPFVQRSIYVAPDVQQGYTGTFTNKRAARDHLQTWNVGVINSRRRAADRTLFPTIESVPREQRASEWHLARKGIIGTDEYLVPGPQAKLNSYGNVSGAYWSKLISDLGASPVGAHTRRSRRGMFIKIGRIIILADGNKGRGVWFIVTKRKPRYKKQFDFYGIGTRTFNKRFTENIDNELLREFGVR